MAREWAIEVWEELAVAANYDARVMASLCQISERQLQRRIKRVLDRSPREWLNEQRILSARQLLLDGLSVKQTAAELGYKQTSHFCRQFKLFTRQTPSEFVFNQFPPILPRRSRITNVALR
jgi:AraC-like DNA-binding protein